MTHSFIFCDGCADQCARHGRTLLEGPWPAAMPANRTNEKQAFATSNSNTETQKTQPLGQHVSNHIKSMPEQLCVLKRNAPLNPLSLICALRSHFWFAELRPAQC